MVNSTDLELKSGPIAGEPIRKYGIVKRLRLSAHMTETEEGRCPTLSHHQ